MRQTLQKKSVFGINIFERTVSQKRKNTCMDQEGDGVRTPPPQPLEITEFKYIIGLPWSPSQVSKQNAPWEKIGHSPLSIFFQARKFVDVLNSQIETKTDISSGFQ